MFAAWKIPLPPNFDLYRETTERIQAYHAAFEWNEFFADFTQALSLFPTKLPASTARKDPSAMSKIETAFALLTESRNAHNTGEGKPGIILLENQAEALFRQELGHTGADFLRSAGILSRDFPGRTLASLPDGSLRKALLAASEAKACLSGLGIEEGTQAGFVSLRNLLKSLGKIPGRTREIAPYCYSQNKPNGTRERSAGAVAWVILELYRKIPGIGPGWALTDEEAYPACSWAGKWERTKVSKEIETMGTKNFWVFANAVAEAGMLVAK